MRLNIDYNDRFLQGMISGGVAGIIVNVLCLLLKRFNVVQFKFLEYATLHILGNPFGKDSLLEFAFSALLSIMFMMTIGVLFVYMIYFVGRKNLYIKSFLFGNVVLYTWYHFLLVTMTNFIPEVSVEVAMVDTIIASLFGLLMGVIYQKISIRHQQEI